MFAQEVKYEVRLDMNLSIQLTVTPTCNLSEEMREFFEEAEKAAMDQRPLRSDLYNGKYVTFFSKEIENR